MKIVSLNCEYGKHHDRTLEFLLNTDADVYCFQEITEHHFDQYASELGCVGCFKERSQVAVDFLDHIKLPIKEGIGIFSKAPIIAHQSHELYEWNRTQIGARAMHVSDYVRWGVQMATIELAGEKHTVISAHMPVSAPGSVTDVQRKALEKLLEVLDNYDEFVLVGDFNSPRNSEVFDTIAERLTDNIPPAYSTSIDSNLHRAGMTDPAGLSKALVDGLFTTPGYEASYVELVSGVSDHMAVVGCVEKRALSLQGMGSRFSPQSRSIDQD